MLARTPLITGIRKFPKNERILDGLMQLYGRRGRATLPTW